MYIHNWTPIDRFNVHARPVPIETHARATDQPGTVQIPPPSRVCPPTNQLSKHLRLNPPVPTPPTKPNPQKNSKTDTFQGIKRGVNDLGLGEMAQDLDLSEIVKGLPPGLRLRTPGLCAYYDDAAAVCHYTTTNGIRARVAGPCSGKLDGVVPTW